MGRDLLRSQNDLISSPFGQGQLLVQGGLPIANGIIGSGGELSCINPTWPGDSPVS